MGLPAIGCRVRPAAGGLNLHRHRAVDYHLFKFFAYHLPLPFEAFLAEGKGPAYGRFQQNAFRGFRRAPWQLILGEVVGGIGIVVAPLCQRLHRSGYT